MINLNRNFLLKEVDNYETWISLWEKVKFANLMQSWEYGEAKKVQGWKPIRFVILDEKNEPKALLQVLFKGLPIIGGVARINRGPVYFQDYIQNPILEYDIIESFSAIKKESRKRRWWYVSMSPELIDNIDNDKFLISLGMKKNDQKISWGSIRLSLEPLENDLFMNLKGKWRNLLRKSQKLEVEVIEVTEIDEIITLIDIYIDFQKEYKFIGVPKNLLVSMFENSADGMNIKVYKTLYENNLSGFVFITHHGDTATYLVGWTSYDGRNQQANYLLLWESIVNAKKENLRWFDMGGVNENTTKGIKHFKEGVNGDSYTLSKIRDFL